MDVARLRSSAARGSSCVGREGVALEVRVVMMAQRHLAPRAAPAPGRNTQRLFVTRAAAAGLSAIVPLADAARGAPLDFARASWVSDLVTNGFAPGTVTRSSSAEEEQHSEEEEEEEDEEDAWAEDLPQGYRCADQVTVHSVPLVAQPQPAATTTSTLTAAAACIPTDEQRLVVAKVSHFRDPETDELDVFKFAAMTNEWSTFTKHAPELQASNYLVQLLGHSKSRSTFCIVSEFCNGGDLQTCVDQQSTHHHGDDHPPGAQPPTPLSAAGQAQAAGAQHAMLQPSSPLGGAEQQQQQQQQQVASCPLPPVELQLQGDGRLSEAQVARVATHVLKGLAAMHRAGLTHGDVKPANVFISTEARRVSTRQAAAGSRRVVLKLGDFGTSREKGRQTMHYFVSGFGYSPEYASPEALRHGTGKAGMASDLWSLGIMLVQLLLGRLPAVAANMARLQSPDSHRAREAYLKQFPPEQTVLRELEEAHVATSPALRHVLARCLQVAPNLRPVDASALLLFDWFAQRQASLCSASSLSSVDTWPLPAAAALAGAPPALAAAST